MVRTENQEDCDYSLLALGLCSMTRMRNAWSGNHDLIDLVFCRERKAFSPPMALKMLSLRLCSWLLRWNMSLVTLSATNTLQADLVQRR